MIIYVYMLCFANPLSSPASHCSSLTAHSSPSYSLLFPLIPSYSQTISSTHCFPSFIPQNPFSYHREMLVCHDELICHDEPHSSLIYNLSTTYDFNDPFIFLLD